jgi:hypothetical protein
MRRPLAVCLAVIAVVVDAVKRHTGWATAHVFEKVFKLEPSWINFYTPSAVPLPLIGLGVGASLNHLRPAIEGGGVLLASRVTMLGEELAGFLSPFWCATAGAHEAGSQGVRSHHLYRAANTNASPRYSRPRVSGRALSPLDDREVPKLLSGEVCWFRHSAPLLFTTPQIFTGDLFANRKTLW